MSRCFVKTVEDKLSKSSFCNQMHFLHKVSLIKSFNNFIWFLIWYKWYLIWHGSWWQKSLSKIDLNFIVKYFITHSCHWHLYILSENFRKPEIFVTFKVGIRGMKETNNMKWVKEMNYIVYNIIKSSARLHLLFFFIYL